MYFFFFVENSKNCVPHPTAPSALHYLTGGRCITLWVGLHGARRIFVIEDLSIYLVTHFLLSEVFLLYVQNTNGKLSEIIALGEAITAF